MLFLTVIFSSILKIFVTSTFVERGRGGGWLKSTPNVSPMKF